MTEAELKLVKAMMELQTGFNDKLMPNWKTNPPPYVDAIWTEAAEAFNHTNWEWWKNSEAELDYGQIKMELIDIWHFVMSELMTHEETESYTHLSFVDFIYEEAVKTQPKDFNPDINYVRNVFKSIVLSCMAPKGEERITMLVASFISAMFILKMDWTEVYKLYVGKNTLNSFRQQHGYKKDTAEYKARWAAEKGWEDNQYLTEILSRLDATKDLTSFRFELGNELMSAFHRSSNSVRKPHGE